MSEGVATFLNVRKGGAQYIFLLVNLRGNTSSQEEILDRMINQFGADLETKGRVVRAHSHKFHDVFNEVKDKAWPDDTANKIEESVEPFLIAIDQDFAPFDPRIHEWAIQRFPETLDQFQSLQKVFNSLARVVRDGGNVSGISEGDEIVSPEGMNDSAINVSDILDDGQVSVAEESSVRRQSVDAGSSRTATQSPPTENRVEIAVSGNDQIERLIGRLLRSGSEC